MRESEGEIFLLMKAFFLILFLTSSTLLTGQTVDSVLIYFLPWKFNIEGEITDELVRNYPGYSKKLRIVEQDKINGLLISLSILNLRSQESSKHTFTARMIIDFYSHDKRKSTDYQVLVRTVRLDSRQNLSFNGMYYYKNFALDEWLQTHVFNRN